MTIEKKLGEVLSVLGSIYSALSDAKTSEWDTPAEPLDEAPKRRGRRKKVVQADAEEESLPKRRGRPRKEASNEDEITPSPQRKKKVRADHSESGNGSDEPPKRRGRPPKDLTEEIQELLSTFDKHDVKDFLQEAGVSSLEDLPIKQHRAFLRTIQSYT